MKTIDKIFKTLVIILGAAGFIIAVYNSITWENSIHNPANDPYILEVAFNLDKQPHQVTQREFNQRYLKQSREPR